MNSDVSRSLAWTALLSRSLNIFSSGGQCWLAWARFLCLAKLIISVHNNARGGFQSVQGARLTRIICLLTVVIIKGGCTRSFILRFHGACSSRLIICKEYIFLRIPADRSVAVTGLIGVCVPDECIDRPFSDSTGLPSPTRCCWTPSSARARSSSSLCTQCRVHPAGPRALQS